MLPKWPCHFGSKLVDRRSFCDLKTHPPVCVLFGPHWPRGMAALQVESAKPPDPVPDVYKDRVSELRNTVITLCTNRQIPYFIQAQLAQMVTPPSRT